MSGWSSWPSKASGHQFDMSNRYSICHLVYRIFVSLIYIQGDAVNSPNTTTNQEHHRFIFVLIQVEKVEFFVKKDVHTKQSFRYFCRLKSIQFLAPIYPPDSYPKIFQLKNASRSCLEKVKLQYLDCTQDWVKSIDAVSHIFCYSSSKWSFRKTLQILTENCFIMWKQR